MTLQVNGFFPGKLTPDATIGGCIDIFENAWPNPENTIRMIEESCDHPERTISWQHAPTLDLGTNQNARTNLLLGVTHFAKEANNPGLQNIHNQFNMLLLAASIPYADRYGIREPLWHEPYGVLKYRSGEEYRDHYDGGTDIGRAVSALVYLNQDFEGGELEFLNFGVKIKPRAGMLVLFPSNYAYRHRSHPIISGTKYALVTWLRDRDTKAYL